jgi:hypothetical protein
VAQQETGEWDTHANKGGACAREPGGRNLLPARLPSDWDDLGGSEQVGD